VARAELKDKGLEFFAVDRSLFKARVLEVYRRAADKVGGMELIEEVSRQ
jgi:hypothetical protein